jgi:arylsulfatase
VLLITIDSLRADHLGCHGYLKNTTPNIDRLAQDGILFTQAISTGTWTIPSIPSILTSLYQPHHGIFSYGDTLNNKAVSLAEVLSKKAYRTAFMGPRFFSEIKGIERGFDYFNNKQENAKADKLTDKVIEWIKGHKKERFFLWLHYFDPHAPYRPPAPYNSMFISNVAANEKPVVNTNPEYAGIPNYALLEGNHGLDYYIAQYDGTIRFVDDQIGRLLNSLKESMIYNDTLIIITADHGELLGEHGIYFVHGGLPLDAVIKIPLIMHYNKYSKGLIIDCQVSLIDLAPTILEILKLEKPAVMIGNSLLYLTRNFQRCPEGISYVGNELMSAVRTPEWKLVHIDYKDLTMFIEEHSKNYEDESYKYLSFDLKRLFSDKSEYVLLNLKQDPEELKIFSGKERFDFLKKKLDAWSRTFPPIQKSKADIPHLDAETKEYLRSLGYVQ